MKFRRRTQRRSKGPGAGSPIDATQADAAQVGGPTRSQPRHLGMRSPLREQAATRARSPRRHAARRNIWSHRRSCPRRNRSSPGPEIPHVRRRSSRATGVRRRCLPGSSELPIRTGGARVELSAASTAATGARCQTLKAVGGVSSPEALWRRTSPWRAPSARMSTGYRASTDAKHSKSERAKPSINRGGIWPSLRRRCSQGGWRSSHVNGTRMMPLCDAIRGIGLAHETAMQEGGAWLCPISLEGAKLGDCSATRSRNHSPMFTLYEDWRALDGDDAAEI
mgnify:CR=1 FL=1